MVANRVAMSLDGGAQSALDGLAGRTNKAQGELVREALVFYTANFGAATTDVRPNLEAYHQMLSSGKHVPLDVDFLHTFLDCVEDDDSEPAPEFFDAIDRVTVFHAHEYHDRFELLTELLDWLLFCGFLTVRVSEGGTFHVVFPAESIKWFMSRFIALNAEQSPFDIEVKEGISKVLLTKVR